MRHPIHISFNKNRSTLFTIAAIPKFLEFVRNANSQKKCIIHFQSVNEDICIETQSKDG